MAAIGFKCKSLPAKVCRTVTNPFAVGCMADPITPGQVVLVGIGAIPGAWLRLRIVNHFDPMVPRKHWGTFAVNLTAAFALGLVLGLHINDPCTDSERVSALTLLVAVGFFGSLSTFSTFAVELLNEWRAGRPFVSLVLALASIAAGLCAGGAGYGLGSYG